MIRRSLPLLQQAHPLIGSAPFYQRHLILRTNRSPKESWPSHFESTSRLYAELGKLCGNDARLKDVGFNFAQAPNTGEEQATWNPARPRFESPLPEHEHYDAYVYPSFKKLRLSTKTLEHDIEAALEDDGETAAEAKTHIYVCTHGSRDCRCSDLGEPLYQALTREARRRGIGGSMLDGEDGVRIGRIGHVGGHKYAGNVLVYSSSPPGQTKGPRCDWYGLLKPSDASAILDAVATGSTLYPNWRGRLGKAPEAVREEWSRADKGKRGVKEPMQRALGDPVTVRFTTWDNDEAFTVRGFEGESLMQVARRHNLPSILATCGGACECATCHVYMPVGDGTPELPQVSEEEEDQLEFALDRQDDSRLGCQIPITKELGAYTIEHRPIRLPRY